jgi:hypothetical protein
LSEITWLVSTNLPSTLAANAALARPAPIEVATSATVTGEAKSLREPSGKDIWGMDDSVMFDGKTKQARFCAALGF